MRPLEDKENTNNKIDKAGRRIRLKCSICPPNRGENANRKPKHGAKKPKKKIHRRK